MTAVVSYALSSVIPILIPASQLLSRITPLGMIYLLYVLFSPDIYLNMYTYNYVSLICAGFWPTILSQS